jgi:DNA-binding CsgD family transcriptional regulator/tetratricopeptide (TPR) repeat protein
MLPIRLRVRTALGGTGWASVLTVGNKEAASGMRIDFVPRPELVGRASQLDLVQQAIANAHRTATSTLILLRGTGGIGKSRLLSESCALAQELGFRVIKAGADTSPTVAPYAVFEEAIVELLVGRNGPDLTDLADAFFDSIAAAPTSRPARLYERNARRALYSVVAAALQERPLVMALDDLHSTDADSISLLSHLLTDVADAPLVVLATARPSTKRDGMTPEDLIDRLRIDARGLLIDLAPLDRDEISELLSTTLDGHPETDLVDYVQSSSLGNPFFVLAAITDLAHAGSLERKGGRIILGQSRSVQEVHRDTAILRRFFKGSSSEALVARVIAAFGKFGIHYLDVVSELTGLSPAETVTAFDNLVAQELVLRTREGHYTFSHEILRATLYEDIGPAERASMHARIADMLSASSLSATNDGVIELATHIAASGRRDATAGLHFLKAAMIAGSVAPLAAADWYGRAASAFPDASREQADALSYQSRNLFLGGQPIPAAEVGSRALQLEALGDLRRRSASIVVNALFVSGDVERALGIIEIELKRGVETCPILAQRCELLALSGRVDEALMSLPEVLQSLEGVSVGNRLVALSHLIHYHAYCGDPEVSAAYRQEIDSRGHETSLHRQIFLWQQLALAAATAGRLSEAEAALRRTTELGFDEASVFGIAGTHATAAGYVGWMRGTWPQTMVELRRSIIDGRRSGAHVMHGSLSALESILLSACGEAARALENLETVRDPIWSTRALIAYAKARALRETGDLDAALAHVSATHEEYGRLGAMNDMEWLLSELADLQVEAGLAANAEATLAELTTFRSATDANLRTVLLERTRAIVHRDADAALRSVEAAEQAGLPFEQARGRLLISTLGGSPEPHLRIALDIFDTLGAGPWKRRATTELKSHGLEVPESSHSIGATPLTETELRLIEFVGKDMSNKQIATELRYSTKTVEVYLSRLYRKLGCASRIGLMRAAERLVQP